MARAVSSLPPKDEGREMHKDNERKEGLNPASFQPSSSAPHGKPAKNSICPHKDKYLQPRELGANMIINSSR
jgi:hypothetical protein